MSEAPHNDSKHIARYFVQNPQIGWILLLFVIIAGVLGYRAMPKRKDPEVPVRVAAAIVAWPGARAELIEQSVTKRLEAKLAENTHVLKVESTTRTGITVLRFELTPDVEDTGKEFDDIKLRIDSINDLPKGTYPPQFIKDFGDAVALMLTVASPPTPPLEIELRAASIRREIEAVRAGTPSEARMVVISALPPSSSPAMLDHVVARLERDLTAQNLLTDVRRIERTGFVALDGKSTETQEAVESRARVILDEVLPEDEQHPDMWPPVALRDLGTLEARLSEVAGPRYSFRELDDMTDKIQKRLQRVGAVSKVARVGLLPEQITLEFSQEKLGASGVDLAAVANAINARNVNLPGGATQALGRSVAIRTSGEVHTEGEIGDLLLTTTNAGNPVYLRDLFDVRREYQRPLLLNSYFWHDAGKPRQSRSITLGVSMRSGEQIARFGEAVNKALIDVRSRLPSDLVIAHTSDEPRQVDENVELFSMSLFEAIALVVVVALIGFWSVRTAIILAMSVPVTLAMTYAVMSAIGWDIQQISISSMILALGLLVDVPVVASDAIVSALSQGEPREQAAWRGPTRLSLTILFATLTNVVAYLPFLAVREDIGRFIRSLPVVMTISLLSAWILSLTFVPMFGALLLRRPKQRGPTPAERRQRGFGRIYSNVVRWAIRHRRLALVGVVALIVAAIPAVRQLKTAFFPKDLSYLSYVDVWLPEDATITTTRRTADQATRVIAETLERWGKEHSSRGKPHKVLRSITSFVGGGGPRFWFSVVPEQLQPNYAQLVVEVWDKHDTNHIVGELQHALSSVPGARIDVRQLETAKPVGIPVSIRLSGDDAATLRAHAERLKGAMRAVPFAERVRDDWGTDALAMDVTVATDRANLMGITNYDAAVSSLTATLGQPIASVRRDDQSIPVVARMRSTERAGIAELDNLYVASLHSQQSVPLTQVAKLDLGMALEKIQRRNHMRTITVSCFPSSGRYASEIMTALEPQLKVLSAGLPPGYELEVGGEQEEQVKGFGQLVTVLAISVGCIFLALAVQFKSAVKPLIVFATIPVGIVGALLSLRIAGSPFGFMAFLGIISLIGVIVSHVIVLFDFIEERREEGEPLEDALVDAGIQRLRPVLITVVATVIALYPLAMHGGPLWEPLCYAQIGGLSVATFVTLLIVPVMYAVFVRDLKLLRWEIPPHRTQESPTSTLPAVTSEPGIAEVGT